MSVYNMNVYTCTSIYLSTLNSENFYCYNIYMYVCIYSLGCFI